MFVCFSRANDLGAIEMLERRASAPNVREEISPAFNMQHRVHMDAHGRVFTALSPRLYTIR